MAAGLINYALMTQLGKLVPNYKVVMRQHS